MVQPNAPHRLMVVAALTLIAAAPAGAQDDRFAHTFRIGEATVVVAQDGSFSVNDGTRLRIPLARVVIFGPEWQGAEQTEATPTEVKVGERSVDIRARMIEKVSGQPWEIKQHVEQRDGGIRFDYELRPLAKMTVNEVSLILDLPTDLFKGKRLLLYPREALEFPPELPPNHHFISAVCTHCVFDAGSPGQISVALSRPRLCNVQDTRQWKGHAFQAFIKFFESHREVGPEDNWKLSFTLTPNDSGSWEMPTMALQSDKPLRIGEVRLDPQEPRVGQLATLHVDLEGTWDTPFWQEQVALDAIVETPVGHALNVPGFYTLDYTRTQADATDDEAGPSEVLTPAAQTGWQVRILPTEAGEHRVTLKATDRTGSLERALVFRVAEGEPAPFIRVARDDPRYFEFGNGEPYFANGLNVCWYRSTEGTYSYDRWFTDLAAAGGNYARIWMPSWAFGFEWGEPGEYRLDRAWQMDYVLRLAEQKGIYIKLCLEDFRRFGGENPYAKTHGGPCETVIEVFTNEDAKRMWRNRMRYAVARWGYSPNILAWEFWNEINCVQGYDESIVRAWTKEMAQHLRGIDPYNHLIVNSLGSFRFEPELWAMPEMDFAQMHGYWHPTWKSTEFGKDMAQMMADHVAMLRPFDKPGLFTEFGLVNENWGLSPRVADDPEGVHVHNGMWGAMMAGAAGVAHLWWWDNYVEPQDLWFHHRGVANFIEGVRWPTESFEPFLAETATDRLRVMGLRGEGVTLLWAQNRAHTWWNVANENPIEPVENARVVLKETPRRAGAESCTVELWNTQTGERIASEKLSPGPEGLVIELGSIAEDVAIKVLAP